MSFLLGKPQIVTPPVQQLPDLPVPTPNDPNALQARNRAGQLAKQRQGLQSTILTTPTGLQPLQPAGSTLLGS